MIDSRTVMLAEKKGIDLAKVWVRPRDGRAILWHAWSFPACQKQVGQALRSRVVWWLHTGEVLKGCSVNLHHKNHVRTDDRFTNLERLSHKEHSLLHNGEGRFDVQLICKTCKNGFNIKRWRLKDKSRGQYCSQKCYQRRGK